MLSNCRTSTWYSYSFLAIVYSYRFLWLKWIIVFKLDPHNHLNHHPPVHVSAIPKRSKADPIKRRHPVRFQPIPRSADPRQETVRRGYKHSVALVHSEPEAGIQALLHSPYGVLRLHYIVRMGANVNFADTRCNPSITMLRRQNQSHARMLAEEIGHRITACRWQGYQLPTGGL